MSAGLFCRWTISLDDDYDDDWDVTMPKYAVYSIDEKENWPKKEIISYNQRCIGCKLIVSKCDVEVKNTKQLHPNQCISADVQYSSQSIKQSLICNYLSFILFDYYLNTFTMKEYLYTLWLVSQYIHN